MITWFVSRHPGALQWIQQCGPAFDCHVPHLDPAQVQRGDTVIGTLPVHLAAQVCARGAAYLHLVLQTPPDARGRELSAQELLALGATLQPFEIRPCKTRPAP
ncbi:MAG: CRISPR-associated protein Csx16 [Rhodoferax sp.]|nr:CRISPR-associated protein Csx16 [Rhodoferax sp.]